MYITVTEVSGDLIDVFVNQILFLRVSDRHNGATMIILGHKHVLTVKESRYEIHDLMASELHLRI